ncbi:putative F-box protein PP2-B8 [Glycine max]|uniref:putative F-box protein PP2-B8 n=1 Tax=Glycine max TaxID=3847 RepID=UPI0003DED362|nr:putative F-box protein PP2-B8 [Glycine max]KAH1247797.1 putative F-box protein PP2-B8 [Glycine max]|eukprot:XP_006582756.1 putative F-box protein PP2-B8 [Glycine max]
MDTITKVLPEECVATIISLTSPKDACQLSLVSPSFKEIADSDAVWANFLPSDCEDIIDQSSTPTLNLLSKKQIYAHLCDYHVLFDNGNMTLSLAKATGKKCIITDIVKEFAYGWMEVEMGEFFSGGHEDNLVDIKLWNISSQLTRFLVVEGVEFRPKNM